MYWVSLERRISIILCPQVFRMFLYFHKILRDSAFNCLSAMMYVSFMPLSLVFMHRRHVYSAVRPLAQWRLVA